MFFRHQIIGRFVFFLLVIGLLMAASRGLYRSGYQDGFVSGMVFTAENGEPAGDTDAADEERRVEIVYPPEVWRADG